MKKSIQNFLFLKMKFKNFADPIFSTIFLSILLVFVCLWLFIYHSITNDIYIYITAVLLAGIMVVFLFVNSKKNRVSYMLDNGMMPYPFNGLEVESFLSGPGNEIRRKNDSFGAPIALISWLYFAVFAVVNSRENQYEYHLQLVNSIRNNVPELLDWLNKMYEILGSQPPLPEELTTEDFDMFFGDS